MTYPIYSQPLDFLHVAVGVIKNQRGEILLAQRGATTHQGGLWEFPGGKVEKGESVQQALVRELQEELNITVQTCEPLIKIRHHYPDLSVLLDVWEVSEFSGDAHGHEGQPIVWAAADQLAAYAFPAANLPILRAVQLPACYAILDDSVSNDLIADFKTLLAQQIKLIQLRLKNSSAQDVQQFLQHAIPLAADSGTKLLLNSAAQHTANFTGLGLHLTGNDLMGLNSRPKIQGWLAASCHNLAQLQQAEKLGVDFAVLAPVLKTASHPETAALGWEQFAALIEQVNFPVYALGGLSRAEVKTARQHGGQGIAGIRTFLNLT
jgi:8-oxo-dGTP diphosphatase